MSTKEAILLVITLLAICAEAQKDILTIKNKSLTCDFEEDSCAWIFPHSEGFYWQRMNSSYGLGIIAAKGEWYVGFYHEKSSSGLSFMVSLEYPCGSNLTEMGTSFRFQFWYNGSTVSQTGEFLKLVHLSCWGENVARFCNDNGSVQTWQTYTENWTQPDLEEDQPHPKEGKITFQVELQVNSTAVIAIDDILVQDKALGDRPKEPSDETTLTTPTPTLTTPTPTLTSSEYKDENNGIHDIPLAHLLLTLCSVLVAIFVMA